MHADKQSQIAMTAAAAAGVLVWLVAPWVIGNKEAWDSGLYFVALLISAFVISLICIKWWEVVAGMYVGQMIYLAIFGSHVFGGEANIMLHGIALVLIMPLVLVAALAGFGLRRLTSNVIKNRGK